MAVGSVWNGGVHAPQALVLMIAVIPEVSQYSPTLILRTLSDYENLFFFLTSVSYQTLFSLYMEKNPNYINQYISTFPKQSHLTQNKSWSTYNGL